MSEVVVVLPLLPVMQIILASVYLPANSISDITGIFLRFNSPMMGASLGIPGLLITSEALRMSSGVCCPSSHAMLFSFRKVLYLSLIVPLSETNTSKFFFFARYAAPVPLSPAPKITILLFIFVFSFNELISVVILSLTLLWQWLPKLWLLSRNAL